MVNLALYSDQVIPENSKIDVRLLKMLADEGRGRRIGYIPSGPEIGRRFFQERKAYYAKIGVQLSVFFDLDQPHSHEDVEELLSCDAIHLSGGHTGAFLKRMKRSSTIHMLHDWAAEGGVLIGTSAGAILMTPTIATDALFSGGRPEHVRGATALSLVPFEFFPHLQAKQTYLADLLRYSTSTSRSIIACADGEGVIVTRDKIECIGEPLWIRTGSVSQVSERALADVF
jgi:dipeptidase E